jgi:hypothetical protein
MIKTYSNFDDKTMNTSAMYADHQKIVCMLLYHMSELVHVA